MPVELAVVPVAGRGTRLLPLTKSQPKEMLPVGDKPVVQYVAEELAHAGIQKLVFVTGPGKTAIENHFDVDHELIDHLRESGHEDLLATLSYERMELEFFYTRQRRQLGLGHAVLCAKPVAQREPFVVALGDTILGLHAQSNIVKRMVDVFEREKADAVIAFETVPQEEVFRYGVAKVKQQQDDFFELEDLVEKPRPEDAPSNLAVASRYVFQPVIFEHLEQTKAGKGNEIQLTDAISRLIQAGGRVLGVSLPPGENRFDIGNFDSYFRSFVEFGLADPVYGENLRKFLKAKLSEE
ncbi:MAG: UTP--glucose-1-phosphate uridylyltransferase [Pirellulaceae bacterium]|jgi:UTP--glucose-1-phosphate uridylyltransferase